MLQDLRFAIRSLAKSPGFTTATVLTLGLGMGASTAVYTLLKRVVLHPLPYPESGHLVRLRNQVPGVGPGKEWDMSTAQYFYFRDHAKSLAEIGLYQTGGLNVAAGGEPQRAAGAVTNAALLKTLGARAVVGRLYDERDDAPGASATVVVSHGFWQRAFGGERDIVGRTLLLNEQPHVVIGVLAPGVDLPQERGSAFPPRTDVWYPMRLDPAGPFGNNHVYPMIARLTTGTTGDGAIAEIERLTTHLPAAFPQAYSTGFFERFGFHTLVYPLKQYVLGETSRNLWILFGAVGLVLLIACGNVANLLLVRSEGRRRETAIRSILGASGGAIARHHLAESAVLALGGGVLAVLLGTWGVDGLASLVPPGVPRMEEVRLDGTVFLFALLLALVVALGLSLMPVLHRGSLSDAGALAGGGRSTTVGVERQRARAVLVVTQVALALVLVVGAGLLIRSFSRLRSVDPGLEPAGVLTVQLFLPRQRYADMSTMWQFYDAVLTRIRALPGVVSAGASEELPFGGGYGCTVQGFEDPEVRERIRERGLTTCAGQAVTTPGFLEALRIPLLAGRLFSRADNENPSTGAVIVSKAFAEQFWPGENPIGKGVKSASGRPPFYHVVGLVGDVPVRSLDAPPALAVYYPVVPNSPEWRWYLEGMHVVVRTTLASPASLLPVIQRVVREVDPAIPLANAEEMEAIVDRSASHISFMMTLLVVAGGVALALAAIGLYGTISYLVARRTSEIGVRLALGAQPGHVQGFVVGGSLRLTLLGIGFGLVTALAVSRVLRSLLFGVESTDPLSYLAAVSTLVAVALVAAWVPARRAARIDPMEALRYE